MQGLTTGFQLSCNRSFNWVKVKPSTFDKYYKKYCNYSAEIYEVGDFLLVDENGQVQTILNDTEFFDIAESFPDLPRGNYYVVRVVEVLSK
jgi:hypothetical protein